MRCTMCGSHATFTHTLFKGTAPVKVNLCDPCAQKSRANEHLAKIKAAHDHAAKGAAVDQFLAAIGKSSAPPPTGT
jgi:protein-arginine kinase activator protein McsA